MNIYTLLSYFKEKFTFEESFLILGNQRRIPIVKINYDPKSKTLFNSTTKPKQDRHYKMEIHILRHKNDKISYVNGQN